MPALAEDDLGLGVNWGELLSGGQAKTEEVAEEAVRPPPGNVASAPPVATKSPEELREIFSERAKANKANALKLTEPEKPAPLTLKEPEKPAPPPASVAEVPSLAPAPPPQVEPAAVASSSHGYMPLFLAQFLVFAAYAGLGVVIVTVPDAFWQSGKEKFEKAKAIVTPKVEVAWSKSEPVLKQAAEAATKASAAVSPYVSKAAAAAKPLAVQAFEAAKPLAKRGQDKIGELFSAATAKGSEP